MTPTPRAALGFRTRPLSDVEVGPPLIRLNCPVCQSREVVFVIEVLTQWPGGSKSTSRYLTCQLCLDHYGEVTIIDLLTDDNIKDAMVDPDDLSGRTEVSP